MNQLLILILLTLTPALELRASIPYGIMTGMNWVPVFVIAVIVNIILGIILYSVFDFGVKLFTKIKLVDKFYKKYVEHVQKKIHKAVEKYGEWAVAIFIGIPLPGSGVYTGALAAYLIGMSKKKFAVACIAGVLIAGIIVTVVMLSGSEVFKVFIK